MENDNTNHNCAECCHVHPLSKNADMGNFCKFWRTCCVRGGCGKFYAKMEA